MTILILFLILFIGVIGFQDEFTSEVTAANAIYVDKNGHGNYTSIQAAIDNATAGDTIYVWAGTYYENVVVNKTVSIIGNGSANTTIDGGGTGDVVKITADWVNFSGFRIVNSGSKGEPDYDAGIELFEVENVTIFYNDCSNNIMGIIIKYSKSNFIINNRCNMNENIGILSFFSNTNAIKNNTCEFNQWYGIDSYNSYSNKIINNTCNHNELCGIIIHNSNSDSILNNICNSNSWCYSSKYRNI